MSCSDGEFYLFSETVCKPETFDRSECQIARIPFAVNIAGPKLTDSNNIEFKMGQIFPSTEGNLEYVDLDRQPSMNFEIYFISV